VRRVALVGLGKQAALKTAAFDGVGSSLAGLAKSTKCASLGLLLPEGVADGAAVSKVRAFCAVRLRSSNSSGATSSDAGLLQQQLLLQLRFIGSIFHDTGSMYIIGSLLLCRTLMLLQLIILLALHVCIYACLDVCWVFSELIAPGSTRQQHNTG
jgi:Cytosol aminopeptidase family, N-terminal domain